MRVVVGAVLIVLLSGCGLLGPSPDDLKEALEAVSRGLKASSGYSPQVDVQYSNIADITSAAPDGTIVNKAKLMIDSAHALFIRGTCDFSGYHDRETGYTIDGTVTYKLDDIKKDDPDAMTGEITCNVAMAGGSVKSLELKVLKDAQGSVMTELAANGKKVDLKEWAQAMQMMRALMPERVQR